MKVFFIEKIEKIKKAEKELKDLLKKTEISRFLLLNKKRQIEKILEEVGAVKSKEGTYKYIINHKGKPYVVIEIVLNKEDVSLCSNYIVIHNREEIASFVVNKNNFQQTVSYEDFPDVLQKNITTIKQEIEKNIDENITYKKK